MATTVAVNPVNVPTAKKQPASKTISKFAEKRGREYKPMKATLKYGPNVKISPITNRPIKEGAAPPKVDVYWCEPCKYKLTNPMATLAHITSIAHEKSVKSAANKKVNQAIKRKQPGGSAAKPAKFAKNNNNNNANNRQPATSNMKHSGGGANNFSNNNRQGYGQQSQRFDNRQGQRFDNRQGQGFDNRQGQGFDNRQGFNLTRDDNLGQRPFFGVNSLMQQALGSGFGNNTSFNQQPQGSSFANNLDLLQARLHRNNQGGLNNNYQGQSSGGYWRN